MDDDALPAPRPRISCPLCLVDLHLACIAAIAPLTFAIDKFDKNSSVICLLLILSLGLIAGIVVSDSPGEIHMHFVGTIVLFFRF